MTKTVLSGLCLLVLMCLITAENSPADSCPPDYKPFRYKKDDFCFLIKQSRANYAEAEQVCSQTTGAHLFSASSRRFVVMFMLKEIRRAKLKLTGDILMGMKCSDDRRVCKLPDGTVKPLRIFRAKTGTGKCIHVKAPKFVRGQFLPCDKQVENFICLINAQEFKLKPKTKKAISNCIKSTTGSSLVVKGLIKEGMYLRFRGKVDNLVRYRMFNLDLNDLNHREAHYHFNVRHNGENAVVINAMKLPGWWGGEHRHNIPKPFMPGERFDFRVYQRPGWKYVFYVNGKYFAEHNSHVHKNGELAFRGQDDITIYGIDLCRGDPPKPTPT